MEWYEVILLPLYMIAFVIAGFYFRDKIYANNDPTKRFFIPGLCLKMLGSIAYALIYIYYYQGNGDTFAYFHSIERILESFHLNALMPFNIISNINNLSTEEASFLTEYFYMEETFTVVRLGVPLAIFSFGSFMLLTLLFSIASFTGSWAMYRTFYKANPTHPNAMGVACLMYPSVLFFGSGILKDTVMIFAVGWLLYACYHLFILRKRILLSMLIIPICISLITSIKVYILLGFAPALLYWILLEFPKSFHNKYLKTVVYICCMVGFVGGVIVLRQLIDDRFQAYSMEFIFNKMKSMQKYHLMLDNAGSTSAYDLGDYDPSLSGILAKAPAAINVTFFRPYPSDITNPLIGIACIESMSILLLTALILVRSNFKIPIVLFKNNFIVFCLLFAVIFGFFVGFASFNFGALMRYKIPCLPFFLAAVFLIYFNTIDYEKNNNLLR